MNIMKAKTIKSNAVLISAEELEIGVLNKFDDRISITGKTSNDTIRFKAGEQHVLDVLRRLIEEKRRNPLAT